MSNDELIRKAVKRREALMREIERIDDFINLYKEFERSDDEPDEMTQGSWTQKAMVNPHYRTYSRFFRSENVKVRPKDIGPIARKLLLDHGHPMTRTELLDALKATDVKLAGSDEARYLGTIMWRLRDEFINIDGHGYWPRDIPCEAVGYVPAENDGDDEHPSG